ncbi:MAG: dTDP-4-dehydrorhamnose 3,5-epimerase family protein [Candidatus Aenigmarchaeota archaeon]|nr:dTDP-4-dehydrorhamnose 3,5-epimerase family protein [Candidatus Aenigmarchaeota archaeon]
MEQIIDTPIEGLKIKLGKVVPDERGFLAELSPTGIQHTFFSAGIKNIYISTSTGKHIHRAEHIHKRNTENFYTISGTALWVFVDFRKDSPTFNKVYSVVLGSNVPQFNTNDDVYTIDKGKMAQLLVPKGVFHIYWQLTDDAVRVLALASEPYDKDDYERIDFKTIPEIVKKLNEYGIMV